MPATPRPIDHVVVAVHNLDRGRAVYERLGFTVTPTARHPFGTANALVQLGEAYVELLAVVDPASIPVAGEGSFSFAGFNRRFLERREGASMLALRSEDAAADRAAFTADGLPTYAPVSFRRLARDPAGYDVEVGFSVTFTSDARIPDAGFFTCQHHDREKLFWPNYRAHDNGAVAIDAVVMASRDPADYHIFFSHFTGQHDMRSDSLLLSFETGGGKLEVATPTAALAMYGIGIAPNARPAFIAIRVATKDLAAAAVTLKGNGVPFTERMGRLIVPPEAACGVAIAFVEA
jgi:Glyoxalase-like domain